MSTGSDPSRNQGLGCLGVLVLIGIGWWFIHGPGKGPAPDPASLPPAVTAEQRAADREAARQWLRQQMSERIIVSVSVENRVVRVSPLVWRALTLDSKQSLTRNCADAMKAIDGGSGVEIRSDRNDTVLAEWTLFSGVKVHY